uniref:C2H2-type domain-containing protein n=1 Tax=Schizaphis graminum TaxID=13262 RepID=A0A2S2P541_SCHGA
MCLCKRCFKSNSGLNAQHRLKLHKIKCNKNKPITPILPIPKSIMKFENWNRKQKHPFAIYADVESILRKENDVYDVLNTIIIHHHDLMSYCCYVKPYDYMPQELLDQYEIETGPVIFRGDSTSNICDVAKKFMYEIIEITKKIEK